MAEESYLDLDGCAELLGASPRVLRRAVRSGGFAEPAGDDAGPPYWDPETVQRWWAAQGPDQAASVSVELWPAAIEPAVFLGATRLQDPRREHDEVVLRWSCPSGVVGVLWRPDPSHAASRHLAALVDEVEVAVLLQVDADFGLYGPSLTAVNRAGPSEGYDVSWPDLALVLGQPLPYWPFMLRDPDLIAAWAPGAAPVEAPAIPEVDVVPLLRMAALFDPSHATHRTLLALVGENQQRATRAAVGDLEILAEVTARVEQYAQRWPGLDALVVVAARPLDGGPLTGTDGLDPTVARIGWGELLERTDPLSWTCVLQGVSWDGGRYFPFAQLQRIAPTGGVVAEWRQRLEPATGAAAHFARLTGPSGEIEGPCYLDPLTGAPVMQKADGTLVAAIPQRLPAHHELAELVLGDEEVWVRTADGTVYPAPRDATYGLSWGYSGTGPGVLAQLVDRLLADITAATAKSPGLAPPGLDAVFRLDWPCGTVLDRALLEAARDGRPWNHPDRPAGGRP